MKNALMFVLGAVVGAGATWVVSAKYFTQKNENDIQAIKDDFIEAKEEQQKEIEALNEDIAKLLAGTYISETEEKEIVEPVRTKTKKAVEKPEPEEILKEKFTDYTQYAKKEKTVKEEPVTDVKPVSTKKNKNDPYIIDYRDYLTKNGYDKFTLRYFVNDDLFLDEEGEIANCHKMIGKRNINSLVNESEGEIYVRNDGLEADYDVLLEQIPYGDYAGLSADEEEEE